MSLWQQLKHRKVLRVATAYIIIAWLLLQVATALEETLELPGWFDKVTLAALLLGFPIALLLSWAYELRPERESSDSIPGEGKFAFGVLIAVLLAAGIGYIYFDRSNINESHVPTNPTIAVLPFIDLSPDGDEAWFADGISEEILNVLAKTDGLGVASRTASFHYRGEDVDLKTVAAELNVATILEGSVRSQGDRLRITAQLINAEDGFHLWSETFDRQRDDIFAVQDEISVSIANALFGELGFEALPEVRFQGTRSPAAYDAYLRGMASLNQIDFFDRLKSGSEFQVAVDLDPNFVDAWAGLARAETLHRLQESQPPAVSPALKRALSLDSNNASAVAELALVNDGMGRWLETEQLYIRAIGIEPKNARIRNAFGNFLRASGRIERALNEFYVARQLGSDHPDTVSQIVNTHAYLGQFEQARAVFEEELARVGLENMRGTEAYFVSLLADGLEAEAREFAREALPGQIASARIRFFLERVDGVPGANERLISTIKTRIGTRGRARSSDVSGYLLAGEIELARDAARSAIDRNWSSPSRISLYVDDEVDPRYLPYRANLLLLLDEYPNAANAFNEIGVDLRALAREKDYLD